MASVQMEQLRTGMKMMLEKGGIFMQMTLRWYGSKSDTVTLEHIRQIPGVTGVITTLYDTQPGEVWSREWIHAMKEEVEAAGLQVAGMQPV